MWNNVISYASQMIYKWFTCQITEKYSTFVDTLVFNLFLYPVMFVVHTGVDMGECQRFVGGWGCKTEDSPMYLKTKIYLVRYT